MLCVCKIQRLALHQGLQCKTQSNFSVTESELLHSETDEIDNDEAWYVVAYLCDDEVIAIFNSNHEGSEHGISADHQSSSVSPCPSVDPKSPQFPTKQKRKSRKEDVDEALLKSIKGTEERHTKREANENGNIYIYM